MTNQHVSRRRRQESAPGYRLFAADVLASRRIGASFVRLTFTGEQLRQFGAGGADQRIKLLLPAPGQTEVGMPHLDGRWYTAWQAMPATERPIMRTYTVRAYRPEAAELDVDFVLHGSGDDHGGPAATWAASARPGDRAALVGPDRPGTGRLWGCEWCPPPATRRVLLAGDETAVPAIGAIVESLPPQTSGIVCVEVPDADDRQDWQVPEGVEVRWLVRRTAGRRHGALLEAAVADALDELCGACGQHRGGPGCLAAHAAGPDAEDSAAEDGAADDPLMWEVPDGPVAGFDANCGDLYGWLAGEAGVVRHLRRFMVDERGIPRSSAAFMGYWRQGRAHD